MDIFQLRDIFIREVASRSGVSDAFFECQDNRLMMSRNKLEVAAFSDMLECELTSRYRGTPLDDIVAPRNRSTGDYFANFPGQFAEILVGNPQFLINADERNVALKGGARYWTH